MSERSDELSRLYADWVEKQARDSELIAQYYTMGQGGQPFQLTGRAVGDEGYDDMQRAHEDADKAWQALTDYMRRPR